MSTPSFLCLSQESMPRTIRIQTVGDRQNATHQIAVSGAEWTPVTSTGVTKSRRYAGNVDRDAIA